jgi:hypothetical protein
MIVSKVDPSEEKEHTIGQKVADFITLMVQVTKYEKDGEYLSECDGKELCPKCSSAICKMVQNNNNLSCWRSYITPEDIDGEKILTDLSNK